MVSRTGVWSLWALGLGLLSASCSAPCKELAEQLRVCCANGPAELRQSCEAEAKHLEDDGNGDACESALDQGLYARCAR
jgi:hypothetical protein